jgi:DMSO/TMAO reductase YedYZ molybdopterin-dependent catalytic subunit
MRSKYLSGEDPRQLLEKRVRAEGRLPPGQAASIKWPVLHVGAPPRFDPATWDFKAGGMVEQPVTLTWPEMLALPRTEVTTDFHCVTKWSTFDNRWEGVAIREILSRAKPKPEARFVMALGHVDDKRYGYSTNIPLADLDRDDVVLAMRRNGEEIDADHGGPLRLMVPHLYAWKSCKWIRGLIFMDADKAGYWENLGYHMRGDPFAEERFRQVSAPGR